MTKQASLSSLRAGEQFSFGGKKAAFSAGSSAEKTPSKDWTKLEDADGGTLAIASAGVCEKAFDEGDSNDWRGSTLRKWLNGYFLNRLIDSEMDDAQDIDNYLLPITSDLTSDDGDKLYGTSEDLITLITCGQYRKYYGIIPNVNEYWWTLTPWYIGRENAKDAENARYVRVVNPEGVLYSSGARNDSMLVRPLLKLKSDISVSVESAEGEAETGPETLKPCPFCGSAAAPRLYAHPSSEPDFAVDCNHFNGGCGAITYWYDTPEEAAAAWNRRAEAEAVKVRDRAECDGLGVVTGKCPRCGETMAYWPERPKENTHCYFCGQKLDWGK